MAARVVPPSHARESFEQFLAEQEAAGRIVAPESRRELEEFLEGWWKTVDSSKEEPASAESAHAKSNRFAQAKQSTTAVEPPTESPETPTVPDNWPALTPAEKESAQRQTGVAWWYPIQPRNRVDSVWEHQFVDLGQKARDRLLDFFREVVALGRMSRSINDPENAEVEPLLAQQQKIQQAYDRYIEAKTAIYRDWNRYLSIQYLIGPEVYKVFRKIDNALPDRVEGLESAFDARLKAARRAGFEATEKKVRRTDAADTALVWTDNVITVIEIATLVGSAKAVFTQTAKKLTAKGLSSAAARSVAVAHAVAQVGIAAASAAVVGGVLPALLAHAGLDEADVRAGLAVFRTLSTLVGLRARGKARDRSRSQRPTPKDHSTQQPGPFRWDRTHPLIEGVPDARRTREHTILQQAVADEMQAEGSYVRVGMGVPLSKFSGTKHNPDIEADNMGRTVYGTIDLIEIRSPSQTVQELVDKLEAAMKQLPEKMRGGIRVIDPDDALP